MNQSIKEREIPYNFTHVEFKKQSKWKKQKERDRERQTKIQTLNYREQTDGYQRGDVGEMGEIDDGD